MTVTLFIAMSLDGFIAGPDDDLSWLFTDADYGFDEFFSGVDTLIMGRGTYDVVRSFGKWPYPGKRTIVVSRSGDVKLDTPDTTLESGDLSEMVERLDHSGAKNVWLVGGGELVHSFLKRELIDVMTVSLHPVLLGKGIPLFRELKKRTLLELEEVVRYDNGLVQLNYLVMPSDD